jgi:hypothetical protein
VSCENLDINYKHFEIQCVVCISQHKQQDYIAVQNISPLASGTNSCVERGCTAGRLMFACCFFICPSVIQEDIILAAFIRHGHTHITPSQKKGDDCGVLALSVQGWGCQQASRAMVAPQGSLTLFFSLLYTCCRPRCARKLALSPPQRAAARVFLI